MNTPQSQIIKVLGFISLSSLACAGIPKNEVDQMKTLKSNINDNRDGDCIQGLKDAKPFIKYTERSTFKRPNEDASALVNAATSRCATQAKQDFRGGRYSAGVQKLEAWKRILPSTFPKNKTSRGFMSSALTARGLLEKYKPQAEAQDKTFNVPFQAYSATDATKYPALAYHQLYPLLKQVPPSIAQAERIDKQRDALIQTLKQRKALSHHIAFKGKDARYKDIQSIHQSNVLKNPNHHIDTQSPYAILTMSVGKMTAKTGTKKETFKHKYVASRRTVKNPDYDRNKKKLSDLQKRYASAQKSYSRIKCTGGGVKGKDCGRAEAQRLKSLSKDIQNTRSRMGKPTKTQVNYAYYTYPVSRPYKSYSYPVVIEVRWPGQPKRKPAILKYTATGYSQGTVHASHAKYGIRAQNIPVAPDAKIQSNANKNAAAAFFDVLSKVNADRAAQKFPTNLSPRAAANEWLLRYCVRAPRLPAKRYSDAFKALSADAQKLIGVPDCNYRHYSQSLHSPKSARREFKMLKALDTHRRLKSRRR